MAHYTSIRYGKMFLVGRFKTERPDLRARDRCVVRTDRGKELGEILTPPEPVPEKLPAESLWDILRRAEPQDLVHAERLEKESVPRARQVFRELVAKLNLPMKLMEVDYVWGGERIIFYFKSGSRVDFRDLVRRLAHEFRTRIELKQVGARDEARLAGDCGHCGLTLCCRGFLKELGGISMDMAKIQKHTADPSKITGRCGKLLCCLRYEYPLYAEARDLLPARGTHVDTVRGPGVVTDQNLLLREVTIEQEGGGRAVVKLQEIKGAPASVAGCNGCASPKAGDTAPIGTKARRRLEEDTKVEPPVQASPIWVKAGRVADFPPGGARVLDMDGLSLAVFNVGGELHVLSNACAHEGGPLGEGRLEGTEITCPWHRWKFDVTTGRSVSVSGSSVPKYEVRVEGEDFYVKI